MAGRGPQSFKKRQKEQQRKEWQEEKRAKRLLRKTENPDGAEPDADSSLEDGAEPGLEAPEVSISTSE